MTIPSYDELTPPIPDVLASENVAQLSMFLGSEVTPAARHPRGAEAHTACEDRQPDPTGGLFACLKGADGTGEALMAVAKEFSPRIMRVGGGEVVLDVSGLGRLIGAPDDIARELRRAIVEAEAEAIVAVAPTQAAARVLARAPAARSLAALGPDVLRDLELLPPGITVRDRARPYETLERWGITTLAAFAALPAADLSSRLGRRGIALQRLARGLDPRPFVPDADVPRFIQRLELEWPIDGLEPLSFVLARLLDPLSGALERADRGAAAIRLDLRLTDRATHQRVLQLPSPMRDARVLRTLLLLDLESHPPAAAVDGVAIEVDPAPSRVTQGSLLERAVPSPETLSTLTARLSALVGERRVGSPRVLDTHRPDAFELARFAVAPVAASGTVPSGVPGALVLRRQRIPPAIRVNVSQGRPVYIAPSRRGVPSGAIVQSAGPWRSSGGWWNRASGDTAPGSVAPKPRSGEGGWNRNEWDVALATGAACRIFQDRTTERWFLEATYD